MGEVVNLRLARKRAARAASEDAAARNRTRHGIAKPEREVARREAQRNDRALDGARRGGAPGDGAKPGDDATT